jgi:hypothetical protein
MRTNLLSPDRRARRRSTFAASVVLLGVALLAACNTDDAVTPHQTAVTTPLAQVSQGSGATIYWKVIDENQALLGGSQFKVVGPGNATWVVSDNGAGDVDLVQGQFKMTGMNAGSYLVCETVAPNGFVSKNYSCSTTSVPKGATLSVGIFENTHLPRVRWSLTDEVFNILGGSTWMFTDTTGSSITVTDNGPQDNDKADGKFEVVLPPNVWYYKLCEVSAPAGFVIPPMFKCQDVGVWYGPVQDLGVSSNYYPQNYRLYSVDFRVTDGNTDANGPVLIGPSTFTVANKKAFFLPKLTVVDNGINDYDPQLGQLAVALGAAGTYSICQTQTASANYLLPTPPCKGIDVSYGVPAWAGFFVDSLVQVPYFPNRHR